MPYFHAVAVLSGGRQKTIPNKSESDIFSLVVMPFSATGIITAKWGQKNQSYQALELKIYKTENAWDKKTGNFSDFIGRGRNIFSSFDKKAKALLATDKPRVFMITPIQGSKHGDQEQQRILKEFDERFECIEGVVSSYGGVAIRIDREHPIEDLVSRIKQEIRGAQFLIADLTDERQSCYFEAGYAEALAKPVIYIASDNSVITPGTKTKIHFDIHMNIQFFSNTKEMGDKLSAVIERNREKLFQTPENQNEMKSLIK